VKVTALGYSEARLKVNTEKTAPVPSVMAVVPCEKLLMRPLLVTEPG
jgi:hypothetical protein